MEIRRRRLGVGGRGVEKDLDHHGEEQNDKETLSLEKRGVCACVKGFTLGLVALSSDNAEGISSSSSLNQNSAA